MPWRPLEQSRQTILFIGRNGAPFSWTKVVQAEWRAAIHQVHAVADQPQGGEADSGRHAPHLTIAPFREADRQPGGWNAFSFADWWLPFRQCLPALASEMVDAGRSCALFLNDNAFAECVQLGRNWSSLHLHPIGAPVTKTGIGQALLKAAVGGEQEEAFAVGVQTPGRIDPRDVNPISQATPATVGFRCELTENPKGLVQKERQECFPKQSSRASPQLAASLM